MTKRSLRSSKRRASSAGADSTTSKRSSYLRSTGKKSATKFSRTNSSTDSVSSKRDTVSGSRRREDKRETLSSIDGAERESMNCTTISSIDSESVRSESSKFRDDRSCHSRDSSVASKPCVSERPGKIQPWLSGNPRTSFNKKYVNSNKISSKPFDGNRRNSTLRRSSVTSKQQASKQSFDQNLEYNRVLNNETSSNLFTPRRSSSKDSRKSNVTVRVDNGKFSSEPIKLEAIRSETEEFPKQDFHSTSNMSARKPSNPDPRGRGRRPSTKYSAGTGSPRVQIPETIDSLVEITQQPPGEPRLPETQSGGVWNETEDTEKRSRKFPEKHGQQEKHGKVWRDRRQRSRTVSPVLSKQVAPKTELPTETLDENISVTSNVDKGTERGKVSPDENVRSFKEDVRRKMDVNSARSKLHSRKNTRDALRTKEEEKMSDFNRRKIAGSTNVAKGSLSSSGKPSRNLQQRSTSSRLSAGLHDNVIGARSMQIRSGKSPVRESRGAKSGGKSEKNGEKRGGLKESGPDGLKLPRRDSKAGIAMQVGLKKYIKKLKRVLSDRDNTDIGELASLSLTDAILPDLRSNLSSVEVQQVQNLLNMAEKKSELMQNDLNVGNV
ncbi:hypothetical protein WH47_07506 [Habropoda laboriosa]|uniref:Uncharacterized protein n=1 Tax=Habropoda laboriosa TaxID=597456 RepID=A0A0L7RG90_9HYME|nr:hypothetical protein WH47_07506 [Habropoda laboriosa]